jgi:hypothetical protein
MANPIKENCQLADSKNNPMIAEQVATIADAAVTATTQPNVDEDGIAAGGFKTRALRIAHVTMTEALLVDVADVKDQLNLVIAALDAHGLTKDS